MAFKFKASGTTTTKRVAERPVITVPPIGIKTPLELGDTDGILKMHHNMADVVADNLRNLLLTNWGERLGAYAFGANLRPLLTDWVSQEDFDSKAVQRINESVGRWMSYVSLNDFTTTLDYGSNTTVVHLTVTYNVPALNVSDHKIELALQVT